MVVSRKSRCYDRCFAGVLKVEMKKERLFFLTLTTSPVTVEGLSGRQRLELIQKDFRAFQKRVVRRFGQSCVGIGSKRVVRSFAWFGVRTAEGYGVVHCLHTGCYLPEHWVREAWNEIHGSHIIREKFFRGGAGNVSRYLVSQYVSNQPGGFNPYGWSWNWCYDGFVDDLVRLRGICKDFSVLLFTKDGFQYHPVDYGLFWERFKSGLSDRVFPQKVVENADFKSFMSMVHESSGSVYGYRF